MLIFHRLKYGLCMPWKNPQKRAGQATSSDFSSRPAPYGSPAWEVAGYTAALHSGSQAVSLERHRHLGVPWRPDYTEDSRWQRYAADRHPCQTNAKAPA